MYEIAARWPEKIVDVELDVLAVDPHAEIAALRAQHRVIRRAEDQYMVLRACDVCQLLTHPDTQQIDGVDYVRLNGIPPGAVATFLTDFFLFANGEDHRRKRGLFSRAFGRAEILAARPRVRAAADKMVAALPRGEAFDFLAGMATRLPAELTAAMLGLPEAEATYFAHRASVVAPAMSRNYPHETHAELEDAVVELVYFIEVQLRARLAAPQNDLLTALAVNWDAYREVPFESLVHQVLGLIVGGADATPAAFAMAVALAAGPGGDWQGLRDDPGLIPAAVSEALRVEPPLASVTRYARGPVTFGDATIPKGATICASLLSALRDPDVCARPDVYDIHRADRPPHHPAFGLGPHRCIGEMLARIELEEGLAALTAKAPDLEVLVPPTMRGIDGIRAITPMQVRIR